MSVRPERLEISAIQGNETTADSWRGRLTEVSFLGNTIRYELEVGDGQKLKVDRLAGTEAMLRQGQEAMIHWDPDAAIMVSDNTPDVPVAEKSA